MISTECAEKIQMEFNVSYTSVFLIQKAWAPCEEDAGGASPTTLEGCVPKPSQEQGSQAHRGSSGHQEVPWG